MICSLITLYIIYEVLKNKISKNSFILLCTLLIYLLYFYVNGSDLSHHSSYNKMVFYFLIVSFMILLLVFCFLKYIYTNYRIIFI